MECFLGKCRTCACDNMIALGSYYCAGSEVFGLRVECQYDGCIRKDAPSSNRCIRRTRMHLQHSARARSPKAPHCCAPVRRCSDPRARRGTRWSRWSHVAADKEEEDRSG